MSAQGGLTFTGGKPLAAVCLATLLGGCGVFGGDDRPAYEKSGETPPLEVPPGLSAPPTDSRMNIPAPAGETVSAVALARQQEQSLGGADSSASEAVAVAGVLPEFPDMRVRHDGGARWLEIEADPAVLWPKLRDFWRENDIEIARDEPRLGIIETAWTAPGENQLPGIGLRDKYRVRLERQSADVTNVYVTHRGAEQVGSDSAQRWQPRPADLGLEAEYLTRLMVYFGEPRQQAERQLAAARGNATAMRLDKVAGIPVLVVEDQFRNVWQKTGLALDRAGLPVEEEDMVDGAYYIRYRPGTAQAAAGVLTGLPGAKATGALNENERYQVHLLDQPGQTLITAHTAAREALPPAAAEEILERLITSMQGGGFDTSAGMDLAPDGA
ncbi:MAG: outer membrane protein assembly factor BamC [Gammaproteobacteria bacterium]